MLTTAKQKDLKEMRKNIDAVDRELIRWLGKRKKEVEKIHKWKVKHGKPPLDKKREREILQTRVMWGEEEGLDEEFIKKIFEIIHDYFVNMQRQRRKK